MYGAVTRKLIPENARSLRLWRLLRCSPTLIRRGLSFPGKKVFLERLINTYYGNCINLSLVFRSRAGRWRLRWLALRAVGTYVRNTALYNAPQMWRGFDVYNEEALDSALAQGKGVVVAGQHLGPQRYSFAALGARGIKVVAAMTEQFIGDAEEWVKRINTDLGVGPEAEAVNRVTILAVEKPTCALTMVRALRRGEAVMFDIDGNIGVGGEERTLAGARLLQFLGREVHVRQGVAYLGYRSGAPVLPLIALWGRNGRPELHYFDPLMAREGESLEEFSDRCLEDLYTRLEEVVRERPEQWEMWPHFYKWLTTPEKLATGDKAPRDSDLETERLISAMKRSPQAPFSVRLEDAYIMRIRGKNLLIDAKSFRFFFVSPMARKLMSLLHAGTSFEQVLHELGPASSTEAIFRELGRLWRLELLRVDLTGTA
jgi:lauroyl/myristoyl acyltransferase